MLFAKCEKSESSMSWARVVCLLCGLLFVLAASPIRADIAVLDGVDGVREGQVLSGDVELRARVYGKSALVHFELTGPVNRSVYRRGFNPSFMSMAKIGRPGMWDTTRYPNGDYTLRVTAVVPGGIDSSTAVHFRIQNTLTNTEQIDIILDVDEPITPENVSDTAAAAAPPQIVVVGNASTPTPVVVLENYEEAAGLPLVGFQDRPAQYTRGSGDSIRIDLGGDMPSDGSIVAIAWSNAESRIIDDFAFTMDLDHPHIPADRMDLLPAGSTQLQLLVRRSSQVHRIVRLNLEVIDPAPALSVLPEVAFVDPPAEYVRTSGDAIRVALAEAFPEGADILVLAWSKEQQQMVEDFAFVLGDDMLIPAASLDTLPEGEIQLQLLARLGNDIQQRVTHRVVVVEPIVVEEPVYVALPVVGFDAPPAMYHHDSDLDLAVSVVGPMPEQSDIVVVAWLEDEQRMVSDFSFTLADGGGWMIPAERMEMLPYGPVELQLLVRRQGEIRSVIVHKMDIRPATTVILPSPDAQDRTAVAFGRTPKEYIQGSGRSLPILTSGDFAQGSDLLVIAWSIEQNRLVEDFAFTLSQGPFVIPASQMDLLPEGDVILQLMPRDNNSAYAQIVHRITIIRTNENGGGETDTLPDTGNAGNGNDTDGETNNGNTGSDNGNNGTGGDEVPSPENYNIAFAPGTSNTYERGSGESLALTPSAALPSNTSIRLRAWSDDLERYITNFTQTLSGGPWQVASTQLDLLDDGSYRIDLALYVPDQPTVYIQHHLLITSPGGEGQDASPQSPAAGFTAYSPSPDTQVIYVAANGNDANNGLSPITAVRTLDRGEALMRDGKPDWLLIRRGDTFDLPVDENGSFRYWDKGGRSSDEPMIVGAFGDADEARPRINSNGRGVLRSVKESHLVFRDLHFTANFRDPHGSDFDGGGDMETGISISQTTDLRFEACLVEYFSMNMMFRDGSNSVDPTLKNIILHRCVIRNAYAHGETDSSGLYLKLADGVTINECLFDHNGWDEDVPQSVRRGRNHNIYFSNCTNLTIHGNIIARESYLALKIRCEVEGLTRNVQVTDNLFIECAYPMDMGANGPKDQINFVNVTVSGNVCIRTTGWPLDAPRGTGMKITRVAHARVFGNLFVDNGPNGPEKNEAFRVDGESDLDDIRVYDNDGVLPLLEGEELFSTHYRQRNENPDITFTNNRENVIETRYVDPDRSIETYLQGIGSNSIDSFLRRATLQDSVNWDIDLMAHSVSAYYREGFTLTLFD